MTRLSAVIDKNVTKYAGALEALAKGDGMRNAFVPNELWDERMRLMSAQPIEAIDAWTTAAKRVIELESQLASRDALIERLVKAGNDVSEIASIDTQGDDELYSGWHKLVAEYRASKKESVE